MALCVDANTCMPLCHPAALIPASASQQSVAAAYGPTAVFVVSNQQVMDAPTSESPTNMATGHIDTRSGLEGQIACVKNQQNNADGSNITVKQSGNHVHDPAGLNCHVTKQATSEGAASLESIVAIGTPAGLERSMDKTAETDSEQLPETAALVNNAEDIDEKTIITEIFEDSDGEIIHLVEVPSTTDAPMLQEGQVVGRDAKATVSRRLCPGSFGEIYLGKLVSEGNDIDVVIKVEEQGTWCPQVLREGRAYGHLEGGSGIPLIHWYGLYEPLYTIMIMDLLGPNLEDLFRDCGSKFSMKTTMNILDQMLETLEFIHAKGYVHRDIKPSNFTMGVGKKAHQVHLIDFGLAKRYSDTSQFAIAQWRGIPRSHTLQSFAGTPRFASLPSHLGYEPGPRDDLESLTYMLVYFINGTLPWQNIPVVTGEDRIAKIVELKKTTSPQELCQGIPEEFPALLTYARSLVFCDMPDYDAVTTMFRNLAEKEGISLDKTFDWIKSDNN